MSKNSAIIVVGAEGYIGNYLLKNACSRGVAYGTSSSPSKNLLPLSLNTPENFDYDQIRDGDTTLLTAAISSPDICAREHERAWAVNVTGTATFIKNVINRGARVIFFSSDTVYGEREKDFDEDAACNPAGEYATMKREVEQRFAGDSYFKAIRLSYVFSREDKFTQYLIGCEKRAEEAELFHPFFRAVVHRDDVVEGALALAQHWDETPEQVINFGGPQLLSRVDFAKCLRDTYCHGLRLEVKEPSAEFFKNRPRVIAMTSPILARLLGRSPRTLPEAVQLEFNSTSRAEKII